MTLKTHFGFGLLMLAVTLTPEQCQQALDKQAADKTATAVAALVTPTVPEDTPTASATATATNTEQQTVTATQTAVPTTTATAVATSTPTWTQTTTPSPTATRSSTATGTETISATPTVPTLTPTRTATGTSTGTVPAGPQPLCREIVPLGVTDVLPFLGQPNRFKMFPYNGRLLALWAEKNIDTVTIYRMVLEPDLSVHRPQLALVTVPARHQQYFSAAVVPGTERYAIFYPDGAPSPQYHLNIYDGDILVASRDKQIGGASSGLGAFSDLAWSEKDQLWIAIYYGMCGPGLIHTCTYVDRYKMDAVARSFQESTDWDGSHQLFCKVATGNVGTTYMSVKHPRSGAGVGGVVTRAQGEASGIATHKPLRANETYRHNEWEDLTWVSGNTYAALTSDSIEKNSTVPWGETGDFWIRLARFTRSPGKFSLIDDTELYRSKFTGWGQSFHIEPFNGGFLASYPVKLENGIGAAFHVIDVGNYDSGTVNYANARYDAFTVIGIGRNIIAGWIDNTGMHIGRYECR